VAGEVYRELGEAAWTGEMTSMFSLRRSSGMLGLAAVAVIAVGLQAGPAQAGSVGPKQYFTGVINGKDGNTTKPITIKMACTGGAQTGHPRAGQTLAVHQLFPPASGSLGYTGNDSKIGVFFAAPPGAARAGATGRTFTRYDSPRSLPTSLTLPCAGTGKVWFSPIPVVPPSRSAVVPVRFVSKP
jgi:hypothetical protein